MEEGDPVTRRRTSLIAGALVLGGGLVALAWAALAPLPADSREVLYAFPKDATARGTGSEARPDLPPYVRLTLGVRDILVLRNDSETEQQLGPVGLRPGQTYRISFDQPGVLQLACSAHEGSNFLIFINPPPSAGWERLRWRLGLAGK